MSILADNQLNQLRPVSPYVSKSVRHVIQCDGECGRIEQPVISYGVSSYGYDIRLATDRFLVFQRQPGQLIDPKAFDTSCLVSAPISGKAWVLPGNSYGLGYSLEKFTMPRNVTGVCLGKSTYARCGIIVNTTPLEAGWCGHLTIEISNSSPSDVLLYPGEGIAQVLFFEGTVHPDVSYADRRGKYQHQDANIITARI